MRTADDLAALCRRIDGRPYPAWRDAEGPWDLGDGLVLHVDRVQGDPFAAPSRMRLVRPTSLRFDADADVRRALEDGLLRAVRDRLDPRRRGSGRSGALEVLAPGPEIVERSAVRLHADGRAELRLGVGLPARGRRVLGREGEALLCGDLVDLAEALADGPWVEGHVVAVRQARALRSQLRARGLVAFLADGAVLPRASGVDEHPLADAVPLRAPDGLAVTLDGLDGPVRGLGIPRGVTVITGGGFHGKSTLLAAIASGVRDHVPGDGRETVVTDPHAVKIRAEDGRSVRGVDISPFLRDLPGGRTTSPFDTDDASGSTSQAAALVEAVESGATTLLVDEDTSATNLLVRDARMQQLIPVDREPIVPLVARVGQLHEAWGVSTVFVIGGVGDYLAVADTVIAMDAFVPEDVTARAKALAGEAPPSPGPLDRVPPRVIAPRGLEARKIRSRSARAVDLDGTELDLTGVDGVRDAASARTLGRLMDFVAHAGLVDGRRPLTAVLDALDAILDDEGLEALDAHAPTGGWVRPRRHELAAALSRWRRLSVRS